MTKKKLVLFRLEGCPYCRKAEQYMHEKGIKYGKIEVPREHAERTLLKKVSGQTSVPVLVEVIGAENQDDDIIEYFEKRR